MKTRREIALEGDIGLVKDTLAELGVLAIEMKEGIRTQEQLNDLVELLELCDVALATLDYKIGDCDYQYTYQN